MHVSETNNRFLPLYTGVIIPRSGIRCYSGHIEQTSAEGISQIWVRSANRNVGTLHSVNYRSHEGHYHHRSGD